jgi:hypothetical protein
MVLGLDLDHSRLLIFMAASSHKVGQPNRRAIGVKPNRLAGLPYV